MAPHYESLKLLGDRLLRTNVMKGISWDFIVDSTIDFMDIVGVPEIYENKLFETKLEDYRAELPCDFIEEKMVTINGTPAVESSDPMHSHYSKIQHKTGSISYTLNNRFIFSSLETGKVQIAYVAIMLDKEGYPLLPSNRVFILALEWFVKVAYFNILWEDGKVEDKRLAHAEKEYAWAVGRLESEAQRLSLGKAENFLRGMRTLVPRENEFDSRFTYK